MRVTKLLLRAVLVVAGISCSWQAAAEDWPTKPVRIVVPYSAGGATDAIARYLANKMEESIKKPVVVQNVTGGGTVIGMRQVASSDADGSNLLFTGSSSIAVMKHTMSSLPIDPEKELSPITFVNTLPHWIVVKADRKEKTFEEFIEYIRRNPKTVSISVNQMGGMAHLALANWISANNLDVTIVPYRGSSAAMVDVLGGNITAHVDVVGSSLSLVKAGKARALAVLQEQPIADLPEVPASPPLSAGGLVIHAQHVLAVSAHTSNEVIEKIYSVVRDVTATPEFIQFIQDLGFERVVPTPSESRKIIAEQSEAYKELVQKTGIRIN